MIGLSTGVLYPFPGIFVTPFFVSLLCFCFYVWSASERISAIASVDRNARDLTNREKLVDVNSSRGVSRSSKTGSRAPSGIEFVFFFSIHVELFQSPLPLYYIYFFSPLVHFHSSRLSSFPSFCKLCATCGDRSRESGISLFSFFFYMFIDLLRKQLFYSLSFSLSLFLIRSSISSIVSHD